MHGRIFVSSTMNKTTMKAVIKSILIMLVTLFGFHISYAQRVMNDPTYSPNNYKHPNKAAYMKKKLGSQPVVYVEEVTEESTDKQENSLNSASNYKGMNASSPKIKKFRVANAPAIAPIQMAPAQNGNYKQQFRPSQRKDKQVKQVPDSIPVASN